MISQRLKLGGQWKLTEPAEREHRSFNKQIEFLLERAVQIETTGEPIPSRKTLQRAKQK